MLALKLNKPKKDKKRKKDGSGKPKKKSYKGTGFRIVDDEDPFPRFGRNTKEEESDDETVEELPQIASVVDERPLEVQALEEFQKGKWKHLSSAVDKSPEQDSSPSSNSNRRRHDSDGDLSPIQRRIRHDSDGDLSPPRARQRHDSDESPPRQRRRHDSGDISPPRQRKRHDSGGDLSSPRQRKRHDSGDLSPPRQRKRHDSGDLSPPRRRNGDNSGGRKRRESSGSDLSLPRMRRQSPNSSRDRDFSPPRRPQNRPQGHRRSIANPEVVEAPRGSLPGTTLEGKKAGLQRAADLRNEMVDYRKKENEMFANLDDDVSGRNAKTKIRDRTTGKERDLMAELAKKEEENRIAEEKKKQYDKWGKGLKQVEAQTARVNEAMHEMSKPMARYANDQDLDDYLRVQDRDGDPMLKFLKKKSNSNKPMYNGPPPPPNRFAILPGYRWDGVDRSNGYEREWFSHINDKKAFQDEAYKWSVEDL